MSSTAVSDQPSTEDDNFFSTLLKPGSSLHPTFLLILDCAFLALLGILLSLLYLLSGNAHIIALIGIELCLWASVKWFVNELKRVQVQQDESASSEETKKTQ